MNRLKLNTKRVFGLIALLTCGVWMVQAQSSNGLSVSGGNGNTSASPCFCIGTGGQFTLSYTGGNGFNIRQGSVQWTKVGGGIDITAGANTTQVTVVSQNDTNYQGDYSKYAKGRLKVECVLEKQHTVSVACPGEEPQDVTYYEIKEVSTEIDICKDFFYPDMINDEALRNEIIGPDCVKLGETVTYSIAPWVSQKDANKIGFDDYDWKNAPNEVYYSSDKSSITFKVDQTFLSHKTLAVTMGACNVNKNPVSRILEEEPAEAEISIDNEQVVWEDGYCLPLDAGTTTITIDNYDQSLTYTWKKLDGWDYTVSGNALTFIPADDAREIRLVVSSSCGDKTYDLMISRSFAENSEIVSDSETSTCLTAGENAVFEVTGAGGGIFMTWEIASGSDWTFYTSNTIAKPTITVGTTPCQITVTDECGNFKTKTFYVNPSVPEINSETTCVPLDLDGTINFSVEEDGNAIGYDWVLSNESWSIEDGQGTHSIDVLPGEGSTTVMVSAIGYCENKIESSPVTVDLAPDAPDAIININGCMNYQIEDEVTFSVENADPEYTYSWYIPEEFGTVIGNPNETDGTITVNTKGVSGTIEVRIDAKGDCGPSTWKPELFTVDANGFGLSYMNFGAFPGYTIVNADNISITNVEYRLYQNGVHNPNGAGYAPFPPNTFMLMTGNGNDIANSEEFTFVVDVYTEDCTYRLIVGAPLPEPEPDGLPFAAPYSLRSNTTKSSLPIHAVETDFAKIYPNPTQNILNIDVVDGINDIVDIYVVDTKGTLIIQTTTQNANKQLNSSSWATGSYLVIVKAGNQIHKQVIIKN